MDTCVQCDMMDKLTRPKTKRRKLSPVRGIKGMSVKAAVDRIIPAAA